jgi:hypothetical protein
MSLSAMDFSPGTVFVEANVNALSVVSMEDTSLNTLLLMRGTLR